MLPVDVAATTFPPRGGASIAATPSAAALSKGIAMAKAKANARPTNNNKSTALFSSASGGQAPDCPFSKFAAGFGSIWGSLGVIYILAKAITRVLPIALEPLLGDSSLIFSNLQWRYVTIMNSHSHLPLHLHLQCHR